MEAFVEWRPIPGWPQYEASSEGQIRRLGGKPRRPVPGEYGHLGLVLYGDGFLRKEWVHRLVCAAFHGAAPQPGMHAAHRDGDAGNNTPDNLRWATPVENEADKVLHGRSNRGARNGQAILTEEAAAELKARAALLPRSSGGCRIKKGALGPLAAEYGVTASCARQAIAGRRWDHVTTQGDHP